LPARWSCWLVGAGLETGSNGRNVVDQTASMMGEEELILTSERLVLRRLRVDEADAVAEYKNDPEVARYQDWDLPYPVEEIAAKIAAYEQRPWPCPGAGLNIAIEHEGALIGDFGVGWDDTGTEAEIGYTLRLEHQGKGFATEAVAAVVARLLSEGVERITSSLDPENLASVRVLEEAGFRYESSSRIQIRGEVVDDDVYAIVRSDLSAMPVRETE
jgi:RimJ/RimL family protein N-acetyltransferase